MKKSKLLLVSLFAVLALTGCGSKKTMTCTMENNLMGMESDVTLTVKFNGDKIESASAVTEVKLPDSMKDQKQTLMDAVKNNSATKDAKITETKDGYKVEATSSVDDLGVEESAKYDDVKKSLETLGYKCK